MMGPAMVEAVAATAMVMETAAHNHNPDNVNRIQRLVRLVITAKQKITSNLTASNAKETMPQWSK
jgi:hypothetical protein